ncbi:hypothetical protein E6C60_2129 [Paenibacillus algicola]|uniref:Uncharacterized protein n=2 Tax=Paenibacillus TaxID=44249 RepID=A0A4V1G3Y8_9BACL|nr:hypothetical protein E6C60_2129 [Paenibacillus algicola]
MLKLFKPAKITSMFAAACALSLTLASGVYADTSLESANKEPRALTAPPPVEMNINAANSSTMYITSIGASLQRYGSIQFQLNGSTSSSTVVDSIGVNFILQRWTGSAWVDSGTSSGQSNNAAFYNDNRIFSATTGYYYRGKTIHWVRKGTFYEETLNYTETILR